MNYNENDPIIISSEDEYSISDIVGILCTEMNYHGNVVYDNSKSDGQIKKTISIEKLKRLNSDVHFRSIEDGLKKTVEWFSKNINTCRK